MRHMTVHGNSQGHLQNRPGCTTLCGWLINSFSSVIKIFLQYFSIEDTFYEWIIHKNQPHVCKIPGRPRPGAIEGLATAVYLACYGNSCLPRQLRQQLSTSPAAATTVYLACCNRFLSRLLQQQLSTSPAVETAVYLACCGKSCLPRLLWQQLSTSPAEATAVYLACCGNSCLPRLLRQQPAISPAAATIVYLVCCGNSFLSRLLQQQLSTSPAEHC